MEPGLSISSSCPRPVSEAGIMGEHPRTHGNNAKLLAEDKLFL